MWTLDRIEFVFFYSARIRLGYDVFDGLIRHGMRPILLLENAPRSFTWTKTWDFGVLCQFTKRPIFGGSELFGQDGDFELNLRRCQTPQGSCQ